MRQRRRRLSVSVLAMSAYAGGAWAQPDDEGEESARAVDTLVVTAQRVEENIQDVPISVTALSGDQLSARLVDSFDRLQYLAPGIIFSSGINARQSATTIRGVGVGVFNIGVEGSVALSVDGVTMGRIGAGVFDFADVERVEILRGPQGTLFGKNASGGVISLITKKPTDEFLAEFNGVYGSFNEVGLFGAVSGPLADGVTARLSAYRNTRDGFIDNVNPAAPQDELANRNEFGFRGKVNFELNETTDLLLSADYARRDNTPGGLTYRQESPDRPDAGLIPDLGPGAFNAIGQESIAAGVRPGPGNTQVASDGVWEAENEVFGFAAEFTSSFLGHDFVSLSSWRRWDTFSNEDADLIPQPFLEINSGGLRQEQFSQEFRLSSPRDQRLTYTLGAFFFSQEMEQANRQVGTAGLNLRSPLPGVLPPLLTGSDTTGTDFFSDFDELNYAVFGQGEFEITPSLSVLGGVRVLRSELDAGQFFIQTPASVSPNVVAPFIFRELADERATTSFDDTALTWRLGAKYTVSNNLNFFVTATQGYKSAALVTGEDFAPVNDEGDVELPVARPEKPLQFEAGLRFTGWDNRLIANFTAFHTTIEDLQAQSLVVGPDNTLITSLSNASEAVSKGFEADVTLLPVDGVTLSTAVSYNDATFTSFDRAPCYELQSEAQGCFEVPVDPGDPTNTATTRAQDLAGGVLPNAPEWVFNVLARYDFPITDGIEGFVQSGVQYRGDTISIVTNDPQSQIDAYALVDAQIGVNFMDGNGSLTLFGRNLTDQTFVAAIVPMPFDTGGYAQFVTFESERTYGVRLSLKY